MVTSSNITIQSAMRAQCTDKYTTPHWIQAVQCAVKLWTRQMYYLTVVLCAKLTYSGAALHACSLGAVPGHVSDLSESCWPELWVPLSSL